MKVKSVKFAVSITLTKNNTDYMFIDTSRPEGQNFVLSLRDGILYIYDKTTKVIKCTTSSNLRTFEPYEISEEVKNELGLSSNPASAKVSGESGHTGKKS